MNFKREITTAQTNEVIDEPRFARISTERSGLTIREQGCFIVEGSLYSPSHEAEVDVFYSDTDTNKPKLTASHTMSPVGPDEGIGGQHGYPRWADYHRFSLNPGEDNLQRIALQAKRSDLGPSTAKLFELSDSTLQMVTAVYNSEPEATHTSMGEHLYFSLAGENFDGLMINDQSLDELLGPGAEQNVREGTPLFWDAFDGAAQIDMPAGYTLDMSVVASGAPSDQLGMLVWHRPGTESICFEPTFGFNPEAEISGRNIRLDPYSGIELATTVEIL